VIRESCVLCAVKHIAQARVLLLESKKGYEEFYHFATGHLAEAEDELLQDHRTIVDKLREWRKALEEDKEYEYPFRESVLLVAHQGQQEVLERVQQMEKELDGKSLDELRAYWADIQR